MTIAVAKAPPRTRHRGAGETLVIGLVNIMPDSALTSTEAQFRRILATAAAAHARVELQIFTMPGISRGDVGTLYAEQSCRPFEDLWTCPLDAIIVTGTEPRAATIPEEPFWPALRRLVGCAEDRTLSAVWSCLAAHAAVLHLDGIERRRWAAHKLSGLFDCAKTCDHPLLAAAPARWRVPHSRYNGLPEEALAAHGYIVLSRSPEAGADIFLKQGKSLFVFMQGHPEYDPQSLPAEYRRDVRRYLAHEREDYPEMPCGCFDAATEAAFAAFQRRALAERDPALLSSFPAFGPDLRHEWWDTAVRVYANWLAYLAQQKALRRRRSRVLQARTLRERRAVAEAAP